MLTAWTQIAIFVSAAILVNLVAWYFKLWKNAYPECKNSFLPPGWFIGLVWPILFGFFGYAHYLTYKAGKSDEIDSEGGYSAASIAIIVFAVFCLLYPFLVNHSYKRARILNLLSFVLAFVVGILVIQVSEDAFWFLIPVIVWTGYVNLADYMHMNQSNKCKC